MADRIKGITIKLDGDATGLDKALKGVNGEIRDTEKELKDVNRLLKLDPSNTELLAQKQRLLTKEIGDTQNKLKTLQTAAKDAKKALDNGEISQKQYDALQREIIETESKLKGLQSQAEKTGNELAQSGEKGAKAFDGKKLAEGLATFGKAAGVAIAAVGAATLQASKKFVSAAKDVAEYGDEIDKMSQKLGISAESYQKWDFILEQNGANIESLKAPMKTLATQAQKNSDAFQKLGISQEEVAKLSQEELFERTIAGLQQMGESTERTALASQLLGKGATELGPLLNQTAEDTAALAEQAEKYGFIMSDEAVKASAAFDDSLNVLSKTAEGLKNRLMAEFLPALTQVTDGLALIFTGDMGGLENIEKGINDLITKMSEKAPQIFEVASTIVTGLATAIINNLPALFTAAVELIMNLAEYIIQNLPLLLKTSMTIIVTLAEGIIKALPDLIPALVDVVLEITEYLTNPDTLVMLIEVGVTLLFAVLEGIFKALPQIIARLPQIINNIKNSFLTAIPTLINSIGERISGAWQSITNRAKQWGTDMIQGFISGIMNMINRVGEAAGKIANKIKSFLHFSRPDEGPLRDYETWMPDFVEGLANSLEKSSSKLQNTVRGMATEMSVNMTAPNGISNMLGQYLPYLANRQQIVLDTGVLVGETAPMYNRAFGQIARRDTLR
jgi:phage-related minor tail protein